MWSLIVGLRLNQLFRRKVFQLKIILFNNNSYHVNDYLKPSCNAMVVGLISRDGRAEKNEHSMQCKHANVHFRGIQL